MVAARQETRCERVAQRDEQRGATTKHVKCDKVGNQHHWRFIAPSCLCDLTRRRVHGAVLQQPDMDDAAQLFVEIPQGKLLTEPTLGPNVLGPRTTWQASLAMSMSCSHPRIHYLVP